MRIKFLSSADGSRLIRLRAIRSVRLIKHSGNGFAAARIVANLKGGADACTLAAYTGLEADAVKITAQAQADFDRLGEILNGARLAKGEKWPKEVQP